VASGDIGRIWDLQTGKAKPVRHWVEVLDDELAG